MKVHKDLTSKNILTLDNLDIFQILQFTTYILGQLEREDATAAGTLLPALLVVTEGGAWRSPGAWWDLGGHQGEITGPQEDEGVQLDMLVWGRGRRHLACKAMALRAWV